MAYVRDAQWYYATLVIKIEVEGDPRTVVHLNTVLISADDSEHAYERAIEVGRSHEYEDINPFGKRVVSSFVGVRELDLILDELEHGAEIFYSERVGLSPEAVSELVRPHDALALFSDTQRPSDRPNYSSVEIVDAARKLRRGQGGGAAN